MHAGTPIPQAQLFWSAFAQEAGLLRERILGGRIEDAYHRIGWLLREHGYRHVHELTIFAGDPALVLTPEGDPQIAIIVDALIQAAPCLHGWRLFARRQPRPLSDALRIVASVYQVDLSDSLGYLLRFADGCGVILFTSAAPHVPEEDHVPLLSLLFQHACGEEMVMRCVRTLEMDALPRDTTDCEPLPKFVESLRTFCRQWSEQPPDRHESRA
jgi:hypothetical protein